MNFVLKATLITGVFVYSFVYSMFGDIQLTLIFGTPIVIGTPVLYVISELIEKKGLKKYGK